MTSSLFPLSVQYAVGACAVSDDSTCQDALLHNVFSVMLKEFSVVSLRHDHSLYTEIILTLYRLYTKDKWDPARTYFYIFTSKFIDDEDPNMIVNFTNRQETHLALSPERIVGDCQKRCTVLNGLWFDFDDHYGGDSSSSSSEDSFSESLSEEHSEAEEGGAEESGVESTTTGDPRDNVVAEWEK